MYLRPRGQQGTQSLEFGFQDGQRRGRCGELAVFSGGFQCLCGLRGGGSELAERAFERVSQTLRDRLILTFDRLPQVAQPLRQRVEEDDDQLAQQFVIASHVFERGIPVDDRSRLSLVNGGRQPSG